MTTDSGLARLFLDDSSQLLDQSLIKIRNCLNQLPAERVWWRAGESLNSIGNLVLHISGNLDQWTASGIGGQPDIRDRDCELSGATELPPEKLLARLEQTTATARAFLANLEAADLARRYSIQGFEVSGLQAVNHTVTHFVGHTHQIIYITRTILGDAYRFAWSPDDGREHLPI